MQVEFERRFLRQLAALPKGLQEEVYATVDKIGDPATHKALGVHKLHGKLRDAYSAVVNYRIRIVFCYPKGKPKRITIIAVGNHGIYSND